MPRERLQKILARAGIASRRNAEKLIIESRVKVNGKIVNELGAKADAEKDHIKVDDRLLAANKIDLAYFLCYKPKKTITTLSDPQNRPSVGDLLRKKRIRYRVYPVGRLDWDAEGLLILTNDGELANKIMHPKNHLPKIYIVEVKDRPTINALALLRKGVFIESGVKTMLCKIVIKKYYPEKTALKITLFEGRKNQIKKMFGHIGHSVLSIKRVAIGPLNLSGLKPGEIRSMSGKEICDLKSQLRTRNNQ